MNILLVMCNVYATDYLNKAFQFFTPYETNIMRGT